MIPFVEFTVDTDQQHSWNQKTRETEKGSVEYNFGDSKSKPDTEFRGLVVADDKRVSLRG